MSSISGNGTAIGVTGELSQLKLLSRNRLVFRLAPGSPHRAYVGGSIGAIASNTKDWSPGYQLGVGMIFQIADLTVLGVDYRYVAMPSFAAHTPGINLRYKF